MTLTDSTTIRPIGRTRGHLLFGRLSIAGITATHRLTDPQLVVAGDQALHCNPQIFIKREKTQPSCAAEVCCKRQQLPPSGHL